MATDLSVFGKIRTKADYDRASEEFMLKKQLTQAQIGKSMQMDATKLGENAFMKAAQGLPLTPQEQAAAQLMDAKSGGIQFDPVNGGLVQKPRISDKIGIPGLTPDAVSHSGGGVPGLPTMGALNPNPLGVAPGGSLPDMPPIAGGSPPVADEFEAAYQQELASAAGNPKLQQMIKQKFAASKLEYNADQSKNAGFADRMLNSNPVIDEKAEAGMSPTKNVISGIPLAGNYLVGGDFQQFDQAQRDFINAQLRRESGAAIAPTEFDNARKQYFPQPGDSPEVLAQKTINREAAVNAMKRSAGPAYSPKYKEGKAAFDAKKSTAKPVDYTEYFK